MTEFETKFCHVNGLTCVSFHPSGDYILSGGADCYWNLHTVEDFEDHRAFDPRSAGITAICCNPDGDKVFVGGDDNLITEYSFPSGEMESQVTRFTHPVRDMTFSPNGLYFACSSVYLKLLLYSDPTVRIFNSVNFKDFYPLQGHEDAVRCVSFSADSDRLASSSCDGTVKVWQYGEQKQLHSYSVPKSSSDSYNVLRFNWGQDFTKDVLTLPGDKDLILMDTRSSSRMCSLTAHSKPISIAEFSPNGMYTISCGLDNEVWLWDIRKRETLERGKVDMTICGFDWSPCGNNAAMCDTDGRISLWRDVVPSHMDKPFDPSTVKKFEMEDLPSKSKYLDLEADADEEEEDADFESPIAKLAKKRRHGNIDEDLEEEEYEEDFENFLELERPKKVEEKVERSRGFGALDLSPPTAIQSGATAEIDNRRFLAYNMVGRIISRRSAASNSIEIAFNDTLRYKTIRITDHHQYTMASLGSKGAMFGSQGSPESPGCIFFKPFESLSPNSQWTDHLPPGEIPVVVAVTSSYCAVGTNKRFLRIYSHTGIQLHIWSIPGEPVCLQGSASDEYMIMVYSTSMGIISEYIVYDLKNYRRFREGKIPLSPHSSLVWCGMAEDNGKMLVCVDSDGTVRVLTPYEHSEWRPIQDLNELRKTEFEHTWFVGLEGSNIIYVSCKSSEGPDPNFNPVLQFSECTLMLTRPEMKSTVLERNIMMAEMQKELCSEEADEELYLQKKVTMDQNLIRLIDLACESDRPDRALDASKFLSFPRSLEAAILLTNTKHFPNVAQRIQKLYEEVMRKHEEEEMNKRQEVEREEEESIRDISSLPPEDGNAVEQEDEELDYVSPSTREADSETTPMKRYPTSKRNNGRANSEGSRMDTDATSKRNNDGADGETAPLERDATLERSDNEIDNEEAALLERPETPEKSNREADNGTSPMKRDTPPKRNNRCVFKSFSPSTGPQTKSEAKSSIFETLDQYSAETTKPTKRNLFASKNGSKENGKEKKNKEKRKPSKRPMRKTQAPLKAAFGGQISGLGETAKEALVNLNKRFREEDSEEDEYKPSILFSKAKKLPGDTHVSSVVVEGKSE